MCAYELLKADIDLKCNYFKSIVISFITAATIISLLLLILCLHFNLIIYAEVSRLSHTQSFNQSNKAKTNSTSDEVLPNVDLSQLVFKNVALKKPTWSSSVYKSMTASFATDGVKDFSGGFFHSGSEDLDPWLLIDLQDSYWVLQVQIMPVWKNPHSYRFRNIEVRIGNETLSDVCNAALYKRLGRFQGPPANDTGGFINLQSTRPEFGRYVYINKYVPGVMKGGLYHIEITEVEVIAIFRQ